jgi:hypothetical protein
MPLAAAVARAMKPVSHEISIVRVNP